MKIENIMIGGTRLGSWSEVIEANPWCAIVWRFNVWSFTTMVLLESLCY